MHVRVKNPDTTVLIHRDHSRSVLYADWQLSYLHLGSSILMSQICDTLSIWVHKSGSYSGWTTSKFAKMKIRWSSISTNRSSSLQKLAWLKSRTILYKQQTRKALKVAYYYVGIEDGICWCYVRAGREGHICRRVDLPICDIARLEWVAWLDQWPSPRGVRRRAIVGASLAAGATNFPCFHRRAPRCHPTAQCAQCSGTEMRSGHSAYLFPNTATPRSNVNEYSKRRWRNAVFKITMAMCFPQRERRA